MPKYRVTVIGKITEVYEVNASTVGAARADWDRGKRVSHWVEDCEVESVEEATKAKESDHG